MNRLLVSHAKTVLAYDVRCADRFTDRLQGLLGVTFLPEQSGLLLPNCWCVHTFGMSIAIDIIFLDCHNSVTRVCKAVPSNRCVFGPRGTQHTLELSAGQIRKHRVASGDSLLLSCRS